MFSKWIPDWFTVTGLRSALLFGCTVYTWIYILSVVDGDNLMVVMGWDFLFLSVEDDLLTSLLLKNKNRVFAQLKVIKEIWWFQQYKRRKPMKIPGNKKRRWCQLKGENWRHTAQSIRQFPSTFAINVMQMYIAILIYWTVLLQVGVTLDVFFRRY